MIAASFETPAPGVVVAQPVKGFRYAVDAFWLVGLALEGGPVGSAVDLGTGSGVMALLLAGQGAQTLGVDLRPEWTPYWAESLARSALGGRCELVLGDVLAPAPRQAELVVCNPPYQPLAAGPASADAWLAAARTEGHACLADFVRCAAEARAPGGRVGFVLPAERVQEAVLLGRAAGLNAEQRVMVGRKRGLVLLGEGAEAQVAVLTEQDARVLAWVDRARGKL